ncbi:MAG: tyrosine-protein phosphatase [Gemmatales bacterium]|nr:tyrosine-protein phosphatase [Gemmatales bacterium]MDW8387204.1 tyrosine-protein phosphatase [Gemmatales bacterium]
MLEKTGNLASRGHRPSASSLASILTLVLFLATLLAVPFAYYRDRYTTTKRFRVVAEGVLYRSGQMTAEGLAEVIDRYGIRTVINLQDETPDPLLENGQTESEFCRDRGIRYVYMPPDLIPRQFVPEQRPAAIDRFLDIMNDPQNHPVLLHCRAGLHRTGVLAAVYRMEYDGWTTRQALEELKANGFGDSKAIASNDYIMQYILTYTPSSDRNRPLSLTPSFCPEKRVE